MTKALVLGAFNNGEESDSRSLTLACASFDQEVSGKLNELVEKFGPFKRGKAKVYYNLHPGYPVVSVTNLGSNQAGYSASEEINELRENIRCAIAAGVRLVRDEPGVDEVVVDSCGDPEASAEGATLALWSFDELKSEKYKKKPVKISMFDFGNAVEKQEFNRGITLATAQNICRRLSEMPANRMTPTIFAQNAVDLYKPFPRVKVIVRDAQWAEEMRMGAFLSVSHGSEEPAKFLEIHYNNKPSSQPYVMVGKGICFDSGGISIKPSASMDKMRADMMGAANVVSTIYALAALNAEVNVVGLTPLTENLPSGKATKPGDVVSAMNGKTIQIDNTDAEGRLVLADALCYAHEFQPQAILDIATLTGAMIVSLGPCASGVFTTDTEMFNQLHKAGQFTGDRVWRLPLFNYHKTQVTDSMLADCLNVGKIDRQAGSSTAAAFLQEFVKCPKWMHIDIAGVMESHDEMPYLCKGMSGRPVRTLYYFIDDYFNDQQ